jgi:SAM-dependent methyltransferase
MTEPWPEVAPAQYWEERYAGAHRVWSGNPNRALVDVTGTLAPGRALDLGCGEGADVIWLAQQGWDATGVDISATAVERATDAARAAGSEAGRARFRTGDLSAWDDDESYDLIVASFLHSPVALPRTEILHRAAGHVAAGGHLLVISHAAAPPWAAHHHEHRFLSPAEEVQALALEPDAWQVVLAETRSREVTSPSGEPVTLDDGIVLLRRTH